MSLCVCLCKKMVDVMFDVYHRSRVSKIEIQSIEKEKTVIYDHNITLEQNTTKHTCIGTGNGS